MILLERGLEVIDHVVAQDRLDRFAGRLSVNEPESARFFITRGNIRELSLVSLLLSCCATGHATYLARRCGLNERAYRF